MKKKKPYKYNSKSRLISNANSFPFKVNNLKKDAIKNLENTLTKFRVVDDLDNEKESLDNSFLEGRFDKKPEKAKKNSKIREKTKSNSEKTLSQITFFRKLFLTLSGVCAVLLIVLYASNFLGEAISKLYNSSKSQINLADKGSSNIIDDNYLFVGGIHTSYFSFGKYGLDYHYVNVSGKNLTTSKVLNNMKAIVYDYNPSVIFLEFGLSDWNEGISRDEFLSNYEIIIEKIQSNRPNAIIYVESLYPVNQEIRQYDDSFLDKNISNKDIQEINEALKEMAKEKNVKYFDIYSALNVRGNLDSTYTDNGIRLNEEGYKKLLKEIERVVG